MSEDAATPTAPADAAELERVVRAALAERYEAPVLRTDDSVPSRARVRVLPGEPLSRARAAVTAAGIGDPTELVVELDMSSLPWREVPAAGLRLWRQHGHDDAAGELVTEVVAGDPPVQYVATHAGWQLVRLADGATGWVRQELLGGTTSGPAAAALLVPVEPRLGDPARDLDPAAFAREALALEGTPYVWGGTTSRGIDCSGLAQRAAWVAGECWLPRHSTALLQVGERVRPSAATTGELQAGDVLVLKGSRGNGDDAKVAADDGEGAGSREPARRGSDALAAPKDPTQARRAVGAEGPAVHPMHVAIALGPDEAVHASRRNWRVEREAMDSLVGRYRVLGIRRFGTQRSSGA